MSGATSRAETGRGRVEAGVPYEVYRARPGLNISRLKVIERSPLHYQHNLTHPLSSPSMRLGTAGHIATLEPHRFDRDHMVWDVRKSDGDFAPRRGKAWDDFAANANGRTILRADEYDRAATIGLAVRNSPVAMRYLATGEPEVSLEWLVAISIGSTPIPCKGRVDWLSGRIDGGRALVGLKTTRDIRPREFGMQAARLGYRMAWAFYSDGFEELTGYAPKIVEIVVESKPPHDVAVYVIPDDELDLGRAEYRACMKRLVECEAAKVWPGAVPQETVLRLPEWANHDGEEPDMSSLGDHE